jgi:hypothetical protein
VAYGTRSTDCAHTFARLHCVLARVNVCFAIPDFMKWALYRDDVGTLARSSSSYRASNSLAKVSRIARITRTRASTQSPQPAEPPAFLSSSIAHDMYCMHVYACDSPCTAVSDPAAPNAMTARRSPPVESSCHAPCSRARVVRVLRLVRLVDIGKVKDAVRLVVYWWRAQWRKLLLKLRWVTPEEAAQQHESRMTPSLSETGSGSPGRPDEAASSDAKAVSAKLMDSIVSKLIVIVMTLLFVLPFLEPTEPLDSRRVLLEMIEKSARSTCYSKGGTATAGDNSLVNCSALRGE